MDLTELYKSKEPLIEPEELMIRLGVKKPWIYDKTRRRDEGRLPHVKVGKFLRFHWSDVVDWLEAQGKEVG